MTVVEPEPNRTQRADRDRQKIVPEWGVTADDQIVLVAFAVIAAVLLALGWGTLRDDSDQTASAEVRSTSALATGPSPDLSPVEAEFGIDARAREGSAILTGVVDSDATRTAAGVVALGTPGVLRVDNRLRIERETLETASPSATAPTAVAPTTPTPTEPTITVPTTTVPTTTVPTTTVPTTAVPTTAVPTTAVPTETTLNLADQTTAALNELFVLSPVLFESGTSTIVAESLPTLDAAAAILIANPTADIEVGGHTDSRGDDGSNQALSQARADAVVVALRERGVTNRLTSVGYGETQLLEDPDLTPEQQQANRRIDFATP